MTKITELADATLPLTDTDLVEVVQDVAGTPVNKKVAVSELGGGAALDDHFVLTSLSTTQSMPAGWNIVNLNAPSAANDPLGMYNAATPSRLTIPAGGDGWYLFQVNANLEVGNGDVLVALAFNSTSAGSTDAYSWSRENASAPRDLRTSYVKKMVAGDFVSVHFYQNTGATRTLGNRSNLQMIRLFPA